MPTIEEIRAKLKSSEPKAFTKFGSDAPNAVYPFWNTPEGKTTVLRFLPDADEDNVLFWKERQIIKLTFPGIKDKTDKEVTVQVPCNEMWEDTGSCPILKEVRPWFKDPELEQLARKYWPKKTYIFQGFVVSSEYEEDNVPENPIRRFIVNKELFEIIKSSLNDAEIEDSPADFINGRDFKINKTKKGLYASYSTSTWSMRTRSLDDDESNAIEEYKLFDLKEFLPKRPGTRELEVIKEMFEASINEEPYDPDRWASFYKPYGYDFNGSDDKSSKANSSGDSDDNAEEKVEKPTSALEKLKKTAEVEDSDDDETPDNSDPKAILAMIKKRKAQQD